MGGSLQQKVEGHMTPHADTDDRWDAPEHVIFLNQKGTLKGIFGQSVMAQNSIHNLGVLIEDLAPGLQIEALDGNWNVVEAFSLPREKHPFFMGVQFHVESSRHIPENAQLIQFFVNKAREHAYARPDFSVGQKLICPRLCPETGRWELVA